MKRLLFIMAVSLVLFFGGPLLSKSLKQRPKSIKAAPSNSSLMKRLMVPQPKDTLPRVPGGKIDPQFYNPRQPYLPKDPKYPTPFNGVNHPLFEN